MLYRYHTLHMQTPCSTLVTIDFKFPVMSILYLTKLISYRLTTDYTQTVRTVSTFQKKKRQHELKKKKNRLCERVKRVSK